MPGSRTRPARSTGWKRGSSKASPRTSAKKINKLIREEGPKGVKSTIQGDELRVSSKSRDDLQEVMALLRKFDEADLQFVNLR